MNKIFWQSIFIIFLLSFVINDIYGSEKDTLRFGLIKYKSLEDFTNTYKSFVDYISNECGMVPSFQIVDDESLGYQLNNNNFDVGVFKPFPYLKAHTDFRQLEVFASHVAYGADNYSGVILTYKNRGIKTLQDLKGKRFLFVKPTSTSGFRIPKGILKEHNIDIDSSIIYEFSGSHRSSLDSLINGSVSGIAIDKITLNTLDDVFLDSLVILEEFNIPFNAYVFSPELEKPLRDKIKRVMFDAYLNPSISCFNNKLGIEKWYPCTNENYNKLRRYLRIMRSKPSINISLLVKENAITALNEDGDVLSIFKSELVEYFEGTNRLKVIDKNNVQIADFNLEIDISLKNKRKNSFRFKVFLNGKVINKLDIKLDQITSELPEVLIGVVLSNIPIRAQLFKNNEGWFITYGKSDGINDSNYIFIVNSKKDMILSPSDIKKVTSTNIYFKENSQFEVNDLIIVKYTTKKIIDSDCFFCIGNYFNFSSVKPNWDIIGIVIAIITGIIGLYLTTIKKRRFRNMLYQTNDLLKEYIEGKFKIENQIIEQKERISRALESGKISENQFLILNHRIDEIENISRNMLLDVDNIPLDTEREIDEILADGIITEKEYSRLMIILNKRKRSL